MSAIRALRPARMRSDVEELLDMGDVERLDGYKGALVWKERRRGEGAAYAALHERQLVVAQSEQDLHEAIDASRSADNLASRRSRTLAGLYDDEALVRGAGDAQRLLGAGDAQQAADARKVRWIRALGAFRFFVEVGDRELTVDFALETTRVHLSERDLPLRAGPGSPRLHDADAAASVAILEPRQLVRFLEQTLRATDPARFQRYETGVEQLRTILRVDLRRDLVGKITSLSLAARSATSFTFVGRLDPGSAAGFRKDLERAQLFVQGVLGDAVPGTSVTARGTGSERVWVVRNGGAAVARYAVRGGALVGSVGSAPLPRPGRDARVRVKGSLVLKGDLGRIGRLLDFLLDVPREVFGVVSRLGDVTLGVRTGTSEVEGSGRIRFRRVR